ncbi:hypothetical protein Tco_0246966 [Tanacetum coccineum]
MIEGSGSAYQKAKNVEEGVESVTWQATVLVPDGLTFRKGGRMNCGHTAYGMVQSDKVPGWSELLLEHAYSDSQDDTNNNKGGNAPIAISSSCGSEVDLDSGAAKPAVAAGVFSDVEPTSLQIFNCIHVSRNENVVTCLLDELSFLILCCDVESQYDCFNMEYAPATGRNLAHILYKSPTSKPVSTSTTTIAKRPAAKRRSTTSFFSSLEDHVDTKEENECLGKMIVGLGPLMFYLILAGYPRDAAADMYTPYPWNGYAVSTSNLQYAVSIPWIRRIEPTDPEPAETCA